MSSASVIRWIPPFVVGAAAATVGEVAVGVLLYSGEGLLRALTLILATEIGALALGLTAAPDVDHPALVEALRRRWVVCLVAFLIAPAFTTVWALKLGAASTAISQALGLALLGGLPLYAAGNLLGTMDSVRRVRGGPGPRIGSSAAIGATVGILAGGYAVPRLSAPSVLLFVMVALSGSALVQGIGLDDDSARPGPEPVMPPAPSDPVEEAGP